MTKIHPVIEKLHALVTDGDEVDRCYAIRSLASLQSTGSREILEKCLLDEDIDVCVDAATALGELGDERASGKLIESLINDPDGDIKTACVAALAALQSPDAVSLLLQIAEERPKDIVFNTEEWDVWWDMQLESIKALGNMRQVEAVPVLQRVLEQDDCLDIENEIFTTLAKIGGEGDTLLLSMLENGQPRSRRRIAKALGDSQSRETLKPLARALQDTDPDVRVATLLSLAKRNALPYLPVVLRLFKDQHPQVRRQAIETAQKFSENSTHETSDQKQIETLLEQLIPLINDPDPVVQATVLDTLSNLGWAVDQKQAANIIALLSNSSGDCFSAVCRFIAQQQMLDAIPDLGLLLKRNKLQDEAKSHALHTLGKLNTWNSDIELTLGAAIFDDTKTVRIAALEALAELDQAFPTASNVSNSSPDTPDQHLPYDLITQALQGTLLPPLSKREIPVMLNETPSIEADKTPDHDTSDEAPSNNGEDNTYVEAAFDQISQSIAKGEKPHPLSTLDSMAITHVEKQLEEQAQQQIDAPDYQQDTLSEDDKQTLQGFLDLTAANAETNRWLFNREQVDVNIDIQRLAARMMGKTQSAQSIPQLFAVFDRDDDTLKLEATRSLGQLLEKSADTEERKTSNQILLPQLSAKNRDLRIAAARVLGEIGQVDAIEALLAGQNDEAVAMRIQCLHSISKLAGFAEAEDIDFTMLAEQMLQQLGSNEPGVHRAVVEALIALFANNFHAATSEIKQKAITQLIDAGLAGSHGQVKDMSRGLNALDQSMSSTLLLAKLDAVDSSVERRYVVEMITEVHQADNLTH